MLIRISLKLQDLSLRHTATFLHAMTPRRVTTREYSRKTFNQPSHILKGALNR